MRPSNLSPSIDSIPTSKRLGTLASEGIKMLQARDLLNDQVTVQPLKVWHPSRLKTGLRNHLIGRKVSIKTEHPAPDLAHPITACYRPLRGYSTECAVLITAPEN